MKIKITLKDEKLANHPAVKKWLKIVTKEIEKELDRQEQEAYNRLRKWFKLGGHTHG